MCTSSFLPRVPCYFSRLYNIRDSLEGKERSKARFVCILMPVACHALEKSSIEKKGASGYSTGPVYHHTGRPRPKERTSERIKRKPVVVR